jgi:hypothetical protein
MLHAAASRTLDRALDRLADQERRDRDALPPDVTPIYAEDAELEAIRERVEPVREELRTHPETAPFLARITTLIGASA